MRKSRLRAVPLVRRLLGLAAGTLCALALLPAPAALAQLRPHTPTDWALLASPDEVSLRLGVEAYSGQRASLAGLEGELWEVGSFQASWRTGRVLLEISGSALRRFHQQSRFAGPYEETEASSEPWLQDAGDIRVSTTVLLTPRAFPALGTLRFGTRLPTTDNEVGLERDRTDFFALLGGYAEREGIFAGAETGVGIHGTRESDIEQSDVWVFLATAGYRASPLTASVSLLGHADGLPGYTIRGSEEMAELRAGVRAGERRWIEVEGVWGLTDFSPDSGMRILVGSRL